MVGLRTRTGPAVATMAALAAATIVSPPPAFCAEHSLLASYSFDDDVATGPDTFAIWQGAWHTGKGRGRAHLTTAYHRSGFRSLALTDVAGDRDFPEIQGYFPVRAAGHLFFRFSFLTTDAKDELNIALAGPRCFAVRKDGIAFWLATQKGSLVHHSGGSFKTIGPVEAFVWYSVDVDSDLAAGTYSLAVRREDDEKPFFERAGLANAPGERGSAVDRFSFVGAPFSDASNVTYFVDDVVVAAEAKVAQPPLVAPGRRQFFLDLFTQYQLRLLERPRCLPVLSPRDLGLSDEDLVALRDQGRDPPALPEVRDWNAGCRALDEDHPAKALEHFARAEAARPEAPLFTLSTALALARLHRTEEADDRLGRLSGGFRDDLRYAAASAFVGLARHDLARAEEWLRAPADPFAPSPANARIAEQYFFVLLWQKQYELARGYARARIDRLAQAGLPVSVWYERAGDAAFFARDLAVAAEMYGKAEWAEPLPSVFLKEADLAYLAGDLAGERALREHYYGRLAEE